MFCFTLLYVHSSFAIILMGKRELVALLGLSSCCVALPRGAMGLSAIVIVVFPDHTHLLFCTAVHFKRVQNVYKSYGCVRNN